jgi:hypothetical protein
LGDEIEQGVALAAGDRAGEDGEQLRLEEHDVGGQRLAAAGGCARRRRSALLEEEARRSATARYPPPAPRRAPRIGDQREAEHPPARQPRDAVAALRPAPARRRRTLASGDEPRARCRVLLGPARRARGRHGSFAAERGQ